MTFDNIDFNEPNIVPASSICESIFDGTHDSPKQQDNGFKLVTSRHIKANKVLSEEAYFISEEDYIKINKRSRLQTGDVLFTMIGTVGEVCRLSVEPDFAIKNIGVFRPADASDSVWIYYYLLSPQGRKNIEAAKRGTTQQFMSLKELREFPVNFPKDSLYRHKQMLIPELIDSKIDANNTLSKTLEDIAQTIFKSWFIDFDPVKAKMAGEKPAGMDAATAALFPDSMEESELGLIPRGWSWITVGDIADVIDCLHSKKPELLEEGFPYLQLDTISDSGVLRFENAGLISRKDYEKWTSRIEVQGGDCLITNVGRVGAVSQVPDHFKAAIGRNITAIRPKDSALHRSFLIISLLSDFMKKEITRNTDSGTILEALNVRNIPKLKVPGPSESLLLEFTKICDPLQLQIHELHELNVNLRKIRDALLPRLISGELRIPEEMLLS